MQTTIETDEKTAKAEARKQLREEAKRQKKIEAIKNQPKLESLTITIEWKKSRVWGYNPHATGEAITTDGRRQVGTAKASGCGYCKRSTVIADLFNQFLSHKLFDQEVLKRLEVQKPYGIYIQPLNSKWLPYFMGGIGEGCYRQISEVIGGKWECLAYTDSVNVYRYTEASK
jgi:hypothetical protein